MPAKGCARFWKNATFDLTDRRAGPARQPTHAIIVLGAGVRKNGAPSPPLKRRILAGIALHKSLEDSVLVCAGGVGRHGPSEASVMREIALANGVNHHDILLEDKSINTRENIIFSTSIEAIQRARQLHIVSDRIHLPRCRLYTALTRISVDFHGVPTPLSEEPLARYVYYRLYEVIGLFKYAGIGLIDRFRQEV